MAFGQITTDRLKNIENAVEAIYRVINKKTRDDSKLLYTVDFDRKFTCYSHLVNICGKTLKEEKIFYHSNSWFWQVIK
jgi:hypothetical protein